MKKVFQWGLKIFFVCLLAAGTVYFHKTGLLEKTLTWIDGFGVWSYVVFVAVFITATVFFIPSFIFTFSAGILFGLWKGILLSLLGSGLGSLAAFLIGRYFCHTWVQKTFGGHAQFKKLGMIAERKGWKIIALARLSPIFPFLIGNYIFGVTHLKAAHYFFASMLGTIPSASVYTYLGTITGSLAAFNSPERARRPEEWILMIVGFIAVLVLSFYLRKVAETALDEDQ